MGGEVGEVLHIDGYRIEKEEEVENLGFIDYLKDEPLCFIAVSYTHLRAHET